jgi:hypothetical protein
MPDDKQLPNAGEPGPDELARVDEQFQNVIAGGYAKFEAERKMEELRNYRAEIVDVLRRIQKDANEAGVGISAGYAYFTTRDQAAALEWARRQGRMLYWQLRFWVKLYLTDIAIEYVELHPGEKPELKYGEVEGEFFIGMMEARMELMLDRVPKPHMLPVDPPPETDKG